MIVQMIQCDNPGCQSRQIPEEGGTQKKPRPPYGWLNLKGGWYGHGPYFDLVVCGAQCAQPAMEAVPEL